MSDQLTLSKKKLWTLIWEDENLPVRKRVSDVLRSLLTGAPTTKHSSKGEVKVGVVVGHNEKKPGAYAAAPVNMSEYQLNSLVADRLADIADGDDELEIKVFKRKPFNSFTAEITDVYRRVNSWKPELVIELHFNWLNGAGRIEMLYHRGSERGLSLARDLGAVMVPLFTESTLKMVPRSENERGGKSLALANAPCVMTEPFDCSNITHRNEMYALGTDGLAAAYYKGIKNNLK